MGEVFLGRPAALSTETPHTRLNDLAAVKTMRGDLGLAEDFRVRFRREIDVAGSVHGPALARLLAGDADSTPPWMATEYVPGPTLTSAVKRYGPFPTKTVLQLGAHLIKALRAIHAKQVLHRDLKPGNVLLSPTGPKLIDFGVARAFGATTLTATGLMVGTPGFMSPEHVAGSRNVTTASDVFCLASLLCHAATGSDPFGDGPVAAVLYRVSRAETDLSGLPTELRDVLAPCLQAAPDRRPSTLELQRRLGGRDESRQPVDLFPWPVKVAEQIDELQYEAAALCTSTQPLLSIPATPTMPGYKPSSIVGSKNGEWRKPRLLTFHGKILTAAAIAVTLGVTAGITMRSMESRDSSASHFPKLGNSQPAENWHTWKSKLSGKPQGCDIARKAMVCRLVNGSLQAISATDGSSMWHSRTPKGEDSDLPLINPRDGEIKIPGNGSDPTTNRDAVVSTEQQSVQVRKLDSGKIRWTRHPAGVSEFHGPIISSHGRLFVTADTSDGVKIIAYRLKSGQELWSKEISNKSVAMENKEKEILYAAHSYANNLLYVRGEVGLQALDPETGHERAHTSTPCDTAIPQGNVIVCPHRKKNDYPIRALDSDTLNTKKKLPVDTSIRKDRRATLKDVNSDALIFQTSSGQKHGNIVVAATRDSGKVIRKKKVRGATPSQGRVASDPKISRHFMLFADNSSIFSLLLDGSKAGTRINEIVNKTPVKGAPGKHSVPLGSNIQNATWAPTFLTLGSVGYLTYYDGTVCSVALPD